MLNRSRQPKTTDVLSTSTFLMLSLTLFVANGTVCHLKTSSGLRMEAWAASAPSSSGGGSFGSPHFRGSGAAEDSPSERAGLLLFLILIRSCLSFSSPCG
ncbi:hypothetical protein PC129_g20704 [Phytophthora cactorum]|nr:hypothetical protein PC115_g20948 [Phytophthora cactorum]KAG3208265.1 hypothetical protein PC129_g20704 [Phytophthora cactorum]